MEPAGPVRPAGRGKVTADRGANPRPSEAVVLRDQAPRGRWDGATAGRRVGLHTGAVLHAIPNVWHAVGRLQPNVATLSRSAATVGPPRTVRSEGVSQRVPVFHKISQCSTKVVTSFLQPFRKVPQAFPLCLPGFHSVLRGFLLQSFIRFHKVPFPSATTNSLD